MLPKKNRLSGKKVAQLKKQARPINFFGFGLIFLKNKINEPRFGLIISKKIDKRAVVRNRLKRLFLQAIKQNLNKFKPGDYLFLVKRVCLKKRLEQIEDMLLDFLNKPEN